jgi:hypothetical protein
MGGPTKSDNNPFVLKTVLLFLTPILVIMIFILGIVPNQDLFGSYYNAMYWFVVPLSAYLLSTLCAVIIQFVTCHTVNTDIIWKNTWQILLYVYGALGISEFTVIRAPVVSLIPYKGLKGINDILEIERLRKDEFIREKAVCYWLFWGILIGQMNVIGQTTLCAS